MALEGVWAAGSTTPVLHPDDDVEIDEDDDGEWPAERDAIAGRRGRGPAPPQAVPAAVVRSASFLAQLRDWLQRQNPRKYGRRAGPGRATAAAIAATTIAPAPPDDEWTAAESAVAAAAAAASLTEDAAALQAALVAGLGTVTASHPSDSRPSDSSPGVLSPADNPLRFGPRDPRNVWRTEHLLYRPERCFRFPGLGVTRLSLRQGWAALGSGAKGAVQADAGICLAEFLSRSAPLAGVAGSGLPPGWDWSGTRCVALGAGLGLESAILGLLGAEVVSTDGDAGLLPLMRANTSPESLAALGCRPGCRPGTVTCARLVWGDGLESVAQLESAGLGLASLAARPLAAIVAADVAYNPAGSALDNGAAWGAFVATLDRLAGPGTVIFLAHTWRGHEAPFFGRLRAAGFSVTPLPRAMYHPRFASPGCPTRILRLERAAAGGVALTAGAVGVAGT